MQNFFWPWGTRGAERPGKYICSLTSKPVYIITTPRLGLRRWQPADQEPFARTNQDPVVMEFFPRTLTPVETDAMLRRIEDHFERYGYGLYALELLSTGEFLGFTGFSHPSFQARFTPCVEIGWRLKKETWGQGYATEAAGACLRYGFEKLGLNRVLSFTAALNTRSEKVMQKIGMVSSGMFDHPTLEDGHVLRPHVLYEATTANPRYY